MSRIDNIISRFPDFYQSDETKNLFYEYISVFAALLNEAEEDMLGIMRTHWVKTADNAGSKGFDATQKGDLDKIFALYLESLGGTALLKQGDRHTDTEGGRKDDNLYRTRVLSVINVLKNGASTKQGIIDIIAANLGIADDMAFAAEAKNTIRIVEFLPEVVVNVKNEAMRLDLVAADSPEVGLFKLFKATNPNATPTIPEFRLQLNNKPIGESAIPDNVIPTLFNLRIVNPKTGDFVMYNGEIKAGDSLAFLSNGTGLLRGVEFTLPPDHASIVLQPGDTMLQIEAELGFPKGEFYNNDNHATWFDYAQFDVTTQRPVGQFDQGKFDNAVFTYEKAFATLDIQYLKLTPGAFTVVVPWDIPGFSVTIKITDYTLARLKVFGVPQNQVDAIATLKDIEYQTIEAFYKALEAAFAIKKLIIGKPQELKGLIIREAILKDKYAPLNISPREQIAAIVRRVKAAGVYSEIKFEKRFGERHESSDKFWMDGIRTPLKETHSMKESSFTIASIQQNKEPHVMTEQLKLSGVFDYTYFNSLNYFG